MPYARYKTDNEVNGWHQITSIYSTLILATGAPLTGESDPRSGTEVLAYTVSDDADVNWWVNIANGDVALSPIAVELHRTHKAFLALHEAGLLLQEAITVKSRGATVHARSVLEDMLFRARQFSHILAHSVDPLHTIGVKLLWVQNMGLGPLDVPVENGDIEDAVRRMLKEIDERNLVAPQVPTAWADLSGMRRNTYDLFTIVGGIDPLADLGHRSHLDGMPVPPPDPDPPPKV